MQQSDTKKIRMLTVGGLSGIAMSLFFSAMWITAVIVNGAWRFGLDTLSELGGDVPSRWIFNTGVIVAGVLGIFIAIALSIFLSPLRLGIVGGLVLMIACVWLIAVGVFPIDTGTPHEIVSVAFFGTAAIAGFLLLEPLAIKGGFYSVPFIATLALLAISFSFMAFTSVPLAEAVAVIGLLVWVLILSCWVFANRKM